MGSIWRTTTPTSHNSSNLTREWHSQVQPLSDSADLAEAERAIGDAGCRWDKGS